MELKLAVTVIPVLAGLVPGVTLMVGVDTEVVHGYVNCGAVGAITGFIALGKHGDLNDKCPGGTCPASAQSDVDGYKSMGTISTIGFLDDLRTPRPRKQVLRTTEAIFNATRTAALDLLADLGETPVPAERTRCARGQAQEGDGSAGNRQAAGYLVPLAAPQCSGAAAACRRRLARSASRSSPSLLFTLFYPAKPPAS